VLGKIAYTLFYSPLAQIRLCLKEGGLIEQIKTRHGMRHMEDHIHQMSPLSYPETDGLRLHFLTGTRFWYQTVSCIASWCVHAGPTPFVHLYDDGTLTSYQIDKCHQLLPGMVYHSHADAENKLATHLPESHYPRLWDLWHTYPNIRKLTDVHLGSTGWKLVMDSDILYFKQPEILIHWLTHPDCPLHAIDSEESYGYPRSTMQNLCGHTIRPKVNVGLCGLQSESINWEVLEHWCDTLIQKHGKHYYLEQALVAMLVSGQECTVAPEKEYVTLPVSPEAVRCHATMHHYVADSKKFYFRENWKRALIS